MVDSDYRYRVKFQFKGKTRYGIVNSYSPNAVSAKESGCLLIEDAVTSQQYTVLDDENVIDIPSHFNVADEYCQYVEKSMQDAIALSDSITDGIAVGSMFKIGVADGYAYYIVTKVNRKTCHIDWRGFCPDRYRDHYFLWGGKFPLPDVQRYVTSERAMQRLFARR